MATNPAALVVPPNAIIATYVDARHKVFMILLRDKAGEERWLPCNEDLLIQLKKYDDAVKSGFQYADVHMHKARTTTGTGTTFNFATHWFRTQ